MEKESRPDKTPKDRKETLELLRTFWTSETIADHLYSILAERYRDTERQDAIAKIGKMERGHAAVWNHIARQTHHVSFEASRRLKFQIVLTKLLSLMLPLTLFIHYMEHHERNSILNYAMLFETFKDDEGTKNTIINVIRQEIGHEWIMMEQLADRRSYIAKAKEAIHGMTAGIIETLALVIGLIAVNATSSLIGVTGLIAMMGGLIAIMTISYLTSKGHYDLHEGRMRELTIKRDVHPVTLRHELEHAFIEKGLGAETARDVMAIIGDDSLTLSNLIKTVKMAEEVMDPAEAVKTTSLFFLIGTLPVLTPFFVGAAVHADARIPATMAFVLALIIVSIAGFFIAVLSGKKIFERIMHNVFIILGACTATYLIGLAARVFFGIDVGH